MSRSRPDGDEYDMEEPRRTLRDAPNRPGIRTGLIRGTVMYAIARGVTMARIKEATGLSERDFIDQDGWLPQEVMPALWRLIAAACPDQVVSLPMARVAPFSHFGPLTFLLRHAEDRCGALQAFIRYHSVLSDSLSAELLADGPETALRLSHPMDELDGGHAAEMGMGLAVRQLRELLGMDDGLLRIEFRHQPFGPLAEYERFFAVPVLFGKTHNAIWFDTGSLDKPAGEPDPQLYRFIETQLEAVRERLQAIEAPDELSAVRSAITSNAARSEFSAEALARRMGMSLRKLQRLTRAAGTTVRTLLEEAREAHARQLLSDSRLSIEEVAFLLGYSEDRAFRRAFKRWTGQTPAQLRRSA